MSIFRGEGGIVAQCDTCGLVEAVEDEKGRLAPAWATGQLWVDISLAEQRQIPLCFCPACSPNATSPGFDPQIVMQEAKG